MFKKFNWGHGITVFYICFVATVVTALVASFGVDHSLVVDDYYAKDLAYQSQYEKTLNNLESQTIVVNHDKVNHELTVNFLNDKSIKGDIDFYRPSDKSKDFNIILQERETKITTQNLLSGKWILKIDWTEDGKSFYKEEMINI